MQQQIIQFNRIVHDEEYKKAEYYHNGIKYGAYYELLKRMERFLMKFDLTFFTSLTDKLIGQRLAKSTEFTTEAN